MSLGLQITFWNRREVKGMLSHLIRYSIGRLILDRWNCRGNIRLNSKKRSRNLLCKPKFILSPQTSILNWRIFSKLICQCLPPRTYYNLNFQHPLNSLSINLRAPFNRVRSNQIRVFSKFLFRISLELHCSNKFGLVEVSQTHSYCSNL
jgi:hypothetical protein